VPGRHITIALKPLFAGGILIAFDSFFYESLAGPREELVVFQTLRGIIQCVRV